MRPDRVRIVLDPEVTEKNLAPLVVEHNWMIVRRIPQDGDQPREYIYGTEDGANKMHFIMDHKLGVNFISVTGPDAPQISDILRENLYQEPPPVIFKRARNLASLTPVERRRALYHLALDKMEHGFDQETFDIYSKALKDPDPFVRASAVLGSAYLAWPQLADPIRPLSTDAEPDEGIREDAKLLVGRLDALSASSN
jgi:hypothetical protein